MLSEQLLQYVLGGAKVAALGEDVSVIYDQDQNSGPWISIRGGKTSVVAQGW